MTAAVMPMSNLKYDFIPVPRWLVGNHHKWSDREVMLFTALIKLVPHGKDFDGYSLINPQSGRPYGQSYLARMVDRSKKTVCETMGQLKDRGAVTTARQLIGNAIITLHDPYRVKK